MAKKRGILYSGAALCLIAVVIALFVFRNPAGNAQNVPMKEPTLKGSEVAAEADGSYRLFLNRTMVTSENMGDIFGDQTASYDAKTNTLTLNGARIAGRFGVNWDQNDKDNPFTIHLTDGSDNWIITDDSYAGCCGLVGNTPLVLTGTTGKLSIRTVSDTSTEQRGTYGMGAAISGDIEIVGGILDISVSGGKGVTALSNSSSLRISGGDITLNGNRGYALSAKNLEITGGRLLAMGDAGAIHMAEEGVVSVGAGIKAQTSESRDGGGAVAYIAGTPEGKWFLASDGITKAAEKKGASAASGIDKNVKAGDTVRYGTYVQKAEDKKEPIEWIVLERDGDKALLLSRYALDWMKYHNRFNNVNWTECALREWLNSGFLSEAFSEEETSALLYSFLQRDDSHIAVDFSSDNADRVFLISRTDYERYFPTGGSALCEPTRYLISALPSNLGNTYEDGICWWWLCSGQSDTDAYGGGLNGEVRYRVVNQYAFVRPAIWVSLK